MARPSPLGSLCFLLLVLPCTIDALSSCGGPCQTLNDCSGRLVCIGGSCGDDPDIGTRICSAGGGCQQSGTVKCRGVSYPTYRCSPPVATSTRAILTLNDFSEGVNDVTGQSTCDGRYHSRSERLVALSTGWFNGGSQCGRSIRITAGNGRSTTAKVVGECDSAGGCDSSHAFQPPCRNNVVDASDAVWNALGLNVDDGEVAVTWAMA